MTNKFRKAFRARSPQDVGCGRGICLAFFTFSPFSGDPEQPGGTPLADLFADKLLNDRQPIHFLMAHDHPPLHQPTIPIRKMGHSKTAQRGH